MVDGAGTQEKPMGRCQKSAAGYQAAGGCLLGGCPSLVSPITIVISV